MLELVNIGRAGLVGYVERQLANLFPDLSAPAGRAIDAHLDAALGRLERP